MLRSEGDHDGDSFRFPRYDERRDGGSDQDDKAGRRAGEYTDRYKKL